jgi:hypothetical protein
MNTINNFKNKLLITIFFSVWIFSKNCIIVDTSTYLYKTNINNASILQLNNDDFAQKVIFNDKRKRIFIEYKGKEGWINESALLCSNGSNEILGAMSKNPNLPISLKKKALLVTNIEALVNKDINVDENDQLQVNIYYAPNEDNQYLSSQAKLFQMRYIYKEKDIGQQTFYLIGLNESVNIDNAHSVIQGWVKKDKVLEWNNRIGVEFNKNDGKNAQIFETPTFESIKYTETNKDLMKYYEPRFPLIKKINKETFKIGFIGGSSDGSLSRGSIAKAQQTVNSVIQNNDLQIAIVIDATQGMKPYFKDVKNALNKFLKATKDKANVDIAITIFRDYADGKEIFKIVKNFKSKKNVNLDKIKVKSNLKDNGIGAYPEALFYGINKSIDTLKWSKKNIEKYIIILGDHGNHPNSKQYKQEKSLSTNILGKKLKRKLITLSAIQVSNQVSGKNLNIKKESIKRFPKQLKEIIAHNVGSLGKVISYKKASKENIYNGLVKIYNNFSAVKSALQGLKNNKNTTEKTGFSASILARLGIDPKIFGQISQVTSTGYIKRKAKSFKQKVLIKKRALERLKTSINSLSGTLFRGSYHSETGQRQIKNTVIRIFQDLTGDTIKENENIKRFIFKKTGLPIQTKALKQSINRLIRKASKKKYRLELIKDLERKYIKIHGVLMEKEVKIGRFNPSTGKFSFKEEREKKYFYNLEQPLESKKGILDNSQVLHAWVPIELFP